jgi:hypothetical protein
MKKYSSRSTLFTTLLVAVMHFSLTACQPQQQATTGTAAPRGEQHALEQLADAFRAVAEGLPTNPASLPPEGRKEFVQLVFSKAGYDYHATLTTLASEGLDPSNKLHRDLVELVFFPTTGVAPDDIRRLFDGPEASAIEHIKKVMN